MTLYSFFYFQNVNRQRRPWLGQANPNLAACVASPALLVVFLPTERGWACSEKLQTFNSVKDWTPTIFDQHRIWEHTGLRAVVFPCVGCCSLDVCSRMDFSADLTVLTTLQCLQFSSVHNFSSPPSLALKRNLLPLPWGLPVPSTEGTHRNYKLSC